MDTRVLRDACDACHKNKTKCTSSGGPCDICRLRGSSCRFSQRSKMGRPRFPTGSRTRTTKTTRTRRASATDSATPPGSENAAPRTPEVRSLDTDTIDHISSMDDRLLPLFDPNESNLVPPELVWTPQSYDSHQLCKDTACSVDVKASPCPHAATLHVDERPMGELLTDTEIASIVPMEDYAWTSGTHLPFGPELQPYLTVEDQCQVTPQMQLPQIIYDLRTASRNLKSPSSPSVQWDQIIATVSSLCDTIKTSEPSWISTGSLPSPDLIVVAATVPVVTEIYAVLSDELSSTCSSWSELRRPSTNTFLEFHRHAFAVDLHLTELQAALDAAGLAAYDAHTAQAIDHVHVAVKDLLSRWQVY